MRMSKVSSTFMRFKVTEIKLFYASVEACRSSAAKSAEIYYEAASHPLPLFKIVVCAHFQKDYKLDAQMCLGSKLPFYVPKSKIQIFKSPA